MVKVEVVMNTPFVALAISRTTKEVADCVRPDGVTRRITLRVQINAVETQSILVYDTVYTIITASTDRFSRRIHLAAEPHGDEKLYDEALKKCRRRL